MGTFRQRVSFSIPLLLLILWPTLILAQSVREPVWDGLFYPAQRQELHSTINNLLNQAPKEALNQPDPRPVRALVLPHAGYVFSGPTAAKGILSLHGQQYSKVILLGPDHHAGLKNGCITNKDAYETPLGRIPLHRDVSKLRQQTELFQENILSDQKEHSLEVIIPLLQHVLPNIEIIPVVIGPTDIATMAAAIAPLLDDTTLIVVSSDLSHYLDEAAAHSQDKETLAMIQRLDDLSLRQSPNRACGIWPLSVLLHLARDLDWQPQLLHYSTSAESAHGDPSRVVGYAALAFYCTDPSKIGLSMSQGQSLVRLARHSIRTHFSKASMNEELAEELADPALQARQGTFVTLTKNGQLRGCIGNLNGNTPILTSIQRNAHLAAFSDHRFAPLSIEELPEITIEISILSHPHTLPYTDSNDLLHKLRPHIDGVILRHGKVSATFLPQVWQQLPRPTDFLSYLCHKAGLASDIWLHEKIDIETYQVQYFHEEKGQEF